MYKTIAPVIEKNCSRFNNEVAAVKVHLPKTAAKSRAKAKAAAAKAED